MTVLKSWRLSCWLFVGVIWLTGCGTPPPAKRADIDFHRDIEPIFKARCWNCHGEFQQQGGLRLDQKQIALQGGLSGKRLVDSQADKSELLRRVISEDPAIRMPKEGGRLKDSEVAKLRHWVKAGSPWPELTPPSGSHELAVRYGEDLWSRLSVVGREIKVYLLLAFAICMGIAERIRRIPADNLRWAGGVRRWLWRFSQHASASWFFVALLSVMFWDLIEFAMRQSASVATLERRAVSVSETTDWRPKMLHGSAPFPLRLRGPHALGGTYYRGNDERNESLFNGGNYRTATIKLSLVDEQDNALQRDQAVSGSSLFIRLEIERASRATPSLFTDALMKEVLLTRRTNDQKAPLPTDEPTSLSTLESGERWSAKYRLGDYSGQQEAALDGIVYVYTNAKHTETVVSGTIHYGIVYSLRIRDRTLQQNSELWLGPVLVPGNFQFTNPNSITLPEWIDTNPIPEITGDNSTDPTLLGIPEHLDKAAGPESKP